MVSESTRNAAELVKNSIKNNGINYSDLSDILDIASYVIKNEDDVKWSLNITSYVKKSCEYAIKNHIEIVQMDILYWKTLKVEAPHLFESFMYYMEKNRDRKDRFYEPRVKPLKQVADVIQELADDLLDEIFINMPSRVGKTQIVKFAFLWFGARDPESSNLYTAYSDKITKGFYVGIKELIEDTTYTFKEIFPDVKIASPNGNDETLDLNRAKTYPTFTCRSIYGTLNGACDCNGLATSDDLFSGIEEAISIDRQDTVWGKYDNNFMKRLKRKAKLINMGTRWALKDCQGRRRELLETNPEFKDRRYKIISIPALDENDESNFDYPYDLGYTTQDYRMMRASFEANDDMASWYAQCQQEPIERLGALFTSGSMRFYDPDTDLPDREPDRIFMAVDEAFGGGDYVSAPVCYQYDDTYYIQDVVFNNGDKFITRPLVKEKILEHKVQAVCFEETKTTTDYREHIEDELKKVGFRTNSYGKSAAGKLGKRNRIFDKSPEIREMYFIVDGKRNKEYQKFIQNIYEFKMEGIVKHDDAPDSLAILCNMKNGNLAKATVYSNPLTRRR